MEINVTTTGLLPPEGRAPAHWPDRPFPILLSCLILFLALALSSLLLFPDRERNIPLINKPAWWQLSIIKKLEFLKTGVDVLDKSRAKSQGKPFRILTELGEMIVLPNRYANEIRNNLDLDFRKAIMNVGSNLPWVSAATLSVN